MKTSELFKAPIAELHDMKRQKWKSIKELLGSEHTDEVALRKVTEDMAYIQKAIQDREEEDGEVTNA